MLDPLEEHIVRRNGWLTRTQWNEIIALAQMTPGAIAINTAAGVGRHIAGTTGALAATLGVMLPPLLIVVTLAQTLSQWQDDPALNGAFTALRFATAALVFHGVWALSKHGLSTLFERLCFASALCSLQLLSVTPVTVLLLSALAGVLFNMRSCLAWQKRERSRN